MISQMIQESSLNKHTSTDTTKTIPCSLCCHCLGDHCYKLACVCSIDWCNCRESESWLCKAVCLHTKSVGMYWPSLVVLHWLYCQNIAILNPT